MSPVRRIAALASALFLLVPATRADDQIHLGLLAHDVPDLWSHHNRERGVDLNVEWAPEWPSVALGPGSVGSHLGVVLNSAGDTSYVYGGVNLRLGDARGWYGKVGMGAAYHNGERERVSDDRKALGSRLLFHIPAELGYQWQQHSLALYFAHVSNAYTQNENEGMDVLGLRVGWRY